MGCGNLIAGDDGLGLRVIQELREFVSSDVDLVEGEVRGLDLLDYFMDIDKVIVVDAVTFGGNKGDCYRFEVEELKNMSRDSLISMHQLGIAEVVKIGSMLYPDNISRKIILLGMEIEKVENRFSMELSSEVEKAISSMVELVLKELDEG
ncbi:MAG TPA: hydrogenase maturation protease [Candidatus Eremiobacteraeota bacterium]|nr:hydrogenase maturation protease [Candidatus Eremiobacteraeota bacterium]